MKNFPLSKGFLRRLLLVPVAVIGVGSILATSQVEDQFALPRVTVNANTGAMVRAFDTNISVMAYDAGWGTEIAQGNGWLAAIDMDGAGNAMAVWTFSDRVGAVRLDAATGWETAAIISDPSGVLHYDDPDADLNAGGDGMAVWVRNITNSPTRTDIWAADYTGGTWGAQTLVEADDDARVFLPQVAVDSLGNAVAVWYRSASMGGFSPTTVWANVYTAGGTWGTPEQLSIDTGASAVFPQVGVDGADNFFVLWVQDRDIHTRILPGIAGAWGVEEIINVADPDVNTVYPRLAVDDGGDAFAAWVQGTTLYASRYDSSLGTPAWEAQVALTGAGTLIQSPRVAADGGGDAAVVWVQGGEVMLNQYTSPTGWGTAVALGTGVNPDVAVSATTGIAAWSDTAGAVQTAVW